MINAMIPEQIKKIVFAELDHAVTHDYAQELVELGPK